MFKRVPVHGCALWNMRVLYVYAVVWSRRGLCSVCVMKELKRGRYEGGAVCGSDVGVE